MSVRIVLPGRLAGTVSAPGSKSYTHRALLVAYLAGRSFRVDHPLDSEDTRATADGIRRLGARVEFGRERWTVGPPVRAGARGAVDIDCRESGSSLRFLSAVSALGHREVRFRGVARLRARPMRSLLEALTSLGATVREGEGSALFSVRGPIGPGRVHIDASESSQFTSALLLALPTLSGPSALTLDGPIVSEPYIDATLAVLQHFGVRVARRGRTVHIPGRQAYRGSRFGVPADASSAAYLWVGAALTGGSVSVTGIASRWPQADLAVLRLLSSAGARVRQRTRTISVQRGRLRPFSVELTAAPDLYPLAGVLAAAIPGPSTLRGAAHVVHKESDRRRETVRLVEALGARVRQRPSGLLIDGGSPVSALNVRSLTDHRLVMSAAVGALAAEEPSHIGVAESVQKSFPGFWTALQSLGAEVGGR